MPPATVPARRRRLFARHFLQRGELWSSDASWFFTGDGRRFSRPERSSLRGYRTRRAEYRVRNREREEIVLSRTVVTNRQGGSMRGLKQVLFALAILSVMTTSAYAQATLSGVVKDASGAVLPGVTVEASSDVLIE